MNHEMMSGERDEFGWSALEHAGHVPDFEAPSGGDKQDRMPDMAALTHEWRQDHRAVRRDQRRFDKAIVPAQAMRIGRNTACLSVELTLQRIVTVECHQALCFLMQADEQLLIRRPEADGFAEAMRQRDLARAGQVAYGAAEKELVHSYPHCRLALWLTEPVRVAEFR